MKNFMFTTAALALMAAPAHAQLLGNGSLTGGLGSALDVNSTISQATDTLRTTTRGAIRGSAATDGDQRVDSRSGRVEARRSADVDGSASVAQIADTAIAPVTGSTSARASARGNASGNGEAQAQLIGTDAAGSLVGNAVGEARSAVGTVRGTAEGAAQRGRAVAGSAVGTARGQASQLAGSTGAMASGSASGEASANGNGSAGLAGAPLAAAGSIAAAGNGATGIEPGMPVVTPQGLPIGEVREIIADSRGRVEQVTVSDGEATQVIPAGQLSASGGALVFGEGSADATASSQGDS